MEKIEEGKVLRRDNETTDMALFVRTSDEQFSGWDRQRIVDALIRETEVDVVTAQEISREVEELIASSTISMVTSPLIRARGIPVWVCPFTTSIS